MFHCELQSGSLLTRLTHILLLLQSLLLVDSGNCGQYKLSVSCCSSGGLALDEVCIGGLYGVLSVCAVGHSSANSYHNSVHVAAELFWSATIS